MDLSLDSVERLSSTPGANYCNVRSTSEFKDLLANEFGYLVTPIGFNIEVAIDSPNSRFLKGHGSPEIKKMKAGRKFSLSTEFPSLLNEKGEKKPGPYVCTVRRFELFPHSSFVSFFLPSFAVLKAPLVNRMP